MIVLGIESSCDETAAALIDGEEVLASIVSTQLVHQTWGGVVPELASREHMRDIQPVVQAALSEAGRKLDEVEAIAVTQGPGLLGSLLVGFHFAKALAWSLAKPFLGVNHMEGHIFASFTDEKSPELPCLVLVISGGHTQLVLMNEAREYHIIGETMDDAAGEAFDKVSKLLGLGYPGGPAISREAEKGNASFFEYPRALVGRDTLDFSFSGLKTAVLHSLREQDEAWRSAHLADVCASFEQAVCDQLMHRTLKAIDAFDVKTLVLAGGVAANTRLRDQLSGKLADTAIDLCLPPRAWCTDNAVMIARAAHGRLCRGELTALNADATPRMRLGD